MKPRLFFYALTSALAGFLFGFDTVVISGAEQTIQSLWQLGDVQHGLAMSMALWGTVLGSLLGGWPTEKWGRTRTLQSIGIGCVNLVFTFLGLYLIDRLGRRTLLLIGSLGYIASLGLCAYTFFANAVEFRVAAAAIQVSDLAVKFEASPASVQLRDELDESLEMLRGLDTSAYRGPDFEVPVAPLTAEIASWSSELVLQASEAAGAGGIIVLICIFAFIAAHAVGQGAVIWVLISEIFPTRYRAMGQSLGSFTHWIFAALLTLSFPQMVTYFSPGVVFGFFCFMMVLQLIWVLLMVPETKGVPLEELQSRLGLSSSPPLPQD